MKTTTYLAGVLLGFVPCLASAATTNVTVDSSVMNLGYMNVFDLPAAGGVFRFGNGWGINDLNTSYSNGGATVTFTPNTIGDPNAYWYTPSGGPGAVGNKIMEANLYAEPAAGLYAGNTIVFSGNVSAHTLASGYVFKAFIKDFAPDYSSFVSQEVTLTATGTFTLSLATINDPARHIQWGLQMTGANVWTTDVAPLGGVTVTAAAPATPFSTWHEAFFPGGTADFAADPDGDGLVNLLEFAFNSNPSLPGVNPKIDNKVQDVAGQATLTYTIPIRDGATVATVPNGLAFDVEGIRYHVQGGTALGDWSYTVTEVAPLTDGLPVLDSGWTYHTFTLGDSVSELSKCFIRVKVDTLP